MHSFTKVFFLALLICDPLNASQETAIQSPPTGDNLYTLHQATQSLITAQDLERGDALPYPWQSSFGIQSSIGHGLAEQANTISLVSGAFQPKPGVETQVQAIASRQGYAHAWVQPVDGIRAGFLDSLHELGIQTFSSLSGAVQAKIPASALQALASRRDIRWVGTLPSQAKFHPVLASLIATQQDQERLPIWVSLMGDSGVEGPTATTFITPSLRADATQRELGQASSPSSFDPSASPFSRRMTKAGLKVKAYRENTRTFAVDATVDEIMTLSALNEVHFLSARAQFKPMNDKGSSMSGNANIWADYQNGTLNSVTPIGVIDSGFALHSDLAVERIHFSNGGLDAEQDVYGHGTQVLGALMGRGLSDVDAKGANPFLASRTVGRVWLARYFDDAGNPVGDINDLYTALSTAQSGSWIPKVINCSWGASPIGGAAYSGTEQECLDIDAIAYSTKQLYVFAAGNDGANGASTVGVPGAAANVLTVGNIKSYELTQGDGTLGEIALSSSQGPTADGRMKPELTAPGGGDAGDAGSGVLTTSSTDLSGYVTASGGTSMAVPQVSALAASLTDRYAYLSFNSPALRAALMASAMHPGGAAQDDDYGFGMVDAYRAHHSSSSWEGFHIPHISVKEGFNDALDDSITIPVGTTRMTIAVCWNEPALSTPGGASPVTGHLDLGIDYGRTGANDIVVNGDANYQYLVVDNPTPGPLQLNFIARDTDFDDNGTFERLIAGAAVLLESNTTPSLASSGNLSDDALQLDETSSISTTLSTDVGLASLTIANLMNWSAGLPIESVEYTLQDGSTRFIAAPDATSSVVLGSLIEAAPRTITWSFRGATEGEYALTMKANSDNAGNAVDTYTLWVDSTAPALVTNLGSITHTAGDWSDSNDVRITWDAAIDNDAPNGESGSGIDGYSTSMTQGAGADPDQIANHNESAVLEDFLGLNDGTHFFRIATQDRAGNWSSPAFAQEFGPIMIDTAGPDASGMDLSVTSGHATGVWSNDDTIDFAWSAATEPDDASGLAGYSTDSDTSTLEIAAESTAHTEPFPDGKSNANRFAIIPVDLIGNAGSTSDVLGPFWIDDTAPSAVTGTTPDQPANLWTKNPIFNFPGATATDATSGLAGFDTNGDGIADDNFTRNYPEGNGNEFTIRAIDNATNPGATSTFGPFWVDFTKPTDVTNLAANASANEWLTSDQVQFTWTPSTDDLSGLLGYDLNDDDEADLAAAASSYDAEFPEGKANFFGLAPIDVAKNIGNKNGPIGPFWVDTEAPTTPTQLNADQTESTWSNDNTVGFAWVPSTDATSGLEGYDSTGDGLVDLDPNTVSKVVPFLDGDTNEFSLTPHDIAGNVGVTAGPKGPFWIDTVDPDSPSDLTSDQGVSQWTNDPTVNFSWTAASDDLSGLDGYDSTAGDLPAETTNTPHTFIADGDNNNFDLTAYDAAGNRSSTETIGPFWIDNTPPESASDLTSDQAPNVWTNKRNFIFTWTAATDATSGIAGYDSTGDGLMDLGDVTTTPRPYPDSDGETFTLTPFDLAGNTGSPISLGEFMVDTVAPNQPNNLSATTEVDVWTNDSSVSFSWETATDDRSGLDGYDLNNDGVKDIAGSKTANTPSFVEGDSNTFQIAAIDNAGNPSTNQVMGPFKLDWTASNSVSDLVADIAPETWTNEPGVTFNWTTPADNLSGIAGYSFDSNNSIEHASTKNAGEADSFVKNDFPEGKGSSFSNNFALFAIDEAGNRSTMSDLLGAFWFDWTNPSQVSNLAADQAINSWTNDQDVAFTFDPATDALSGIEGYDTDGDGLVDNDFNRNFPEGVNNEYTIQAIDNAGNIGDGATLGNFWVDITAPVAATNLAGDQATESWTNDPTVNFSWTAASDDLSGLDGYTSSAGPLTAATTNTPHTFIGDGDHHNFDLTAYDIAGNTSSTSIGTFWIDTTAPSKPLALSGDQAPSTWTNDNEIAFTWEAAQDALSGIAGYDSTGDDLLDLPSDALTTSVVFPDGLTNEFSLKAADNATNFGPTAGPKGPFWIDTVKPFDASGLTSSQTPGAWTNNPEVTFNWSAASDDLSGLLGYDLDDNDTVDLPADKTGYTISFEDGAENEFHLAAHDNADNIGNDVGPDAGMFWIDTTAPELTEFTSTTNPDGWAQSPVPGTENYDLNIGWVFFEDDLASGITEYETDFGGTTNTTTDSAFDTTGLIEGEYSFLVRAFDFAGNESSWQDFGPLGIDNSAPTAVRDFVSNTHNPGVWTNATAVDFQWLSALDPLAEPTANQGHPGSGVSGYTYNIEGAETGELLPEDLTLAIDMTDSQGEYRVLMTTHDNVGLDSEEYDWGFLRVDYTNPVATSNLNANQPSDVWLNESDIAFNWDPGSDDISGIEQLRDSDQGGYDITGDGVRDLSGLATSFSMHFDDETATTFDFSVVTIDNAGNLSEGNESLGTFKFDLIDPSQASAFNASEVSGEWLIESDVTFTWSASTDADSGLAGYDTDGDGIVDLAPETTEVTLTYPDGIDNNYQLTPWDIAGNDGAPTANLGPFWVDTVAPTMPGNLAADQPAGMPGENWLTDNTVVFTWDASIDETSGIQGYSMNYGQFILGPDATSRSWNMPEGDQMTFTLEAYDNAGHKSDATETLGPFWVDTIAPTQPGNFVAENHLDGQWSNLQWIHFSWDASTDATSGLDHYELDGINIGTVTEDYFEAPEGITEYTLVAVDVAGNESAISTFTLKIDLTAPPAPVQFESPSHPVGDWVSNYNVDLQWVDFALGVGIGSRSTSVDSGFSHYEIDGEDVGTFKRITRHYGNGTHDVQLISVDLAGNRSEPIMLTVLVDTEAPLAPENFTTTSHDLDTWSNNPGVTMAWDAADDGELGGGIDYYLLDGINIGNGLGITNIYAEGQHSYTLVAVDFAGNQSAASTLGEVWIDTTVPVVDSLTSPTHNDSVWNSNMSVTLEWAAHDDVSGVHHYMLNGADVGAALTWDVLQSSDSQYINDLTAVDEAGNESVIATFDAWLDSTLPEISSFASTSHLPGIWTNNADVDLTWAASDATSGLDHFEIDGLNQGLATSVTNTMADGTHAITLGAFDLAHNENQETVEVMIDTNAPVITAFESTSHPDNATWYSNQDVTLTWGANDDHSGVDHYLLDGAEYAATSATLNGLAEGTQTFTLIAVDLVGIQSAPQSVTVNIDVTAPVVTTFASASHAEASWLSNDSVSLNWAATDTFAGVDHYMLDEVDQGLSAGTAFTQTDGTKVYNLYAVDAAGNASAVSTYEVWVDITNPDLASFTSSTHSDDVWSAVDVANFAWSASDATSGILRYELNGEDLALALSDSREYDDGERLMTLTAFDGAENNSSMTFILKVDTAAPALDSFTSGSHISETWYGSDLVTLAWSATEDGSGVTDFSIDGFSYGTALNNGDGVHAGHGIHEFMLVATDAVGNVSEAMTYTVWVDMNGPTVTSFTSTSHTEQEWSADESISFEWAAVDADSGLDHYLFNDADMGLSTSTTEFLVDGVNTFTLVAVDIMGNESEIATFEAWLDSNIPIVDTFTSTSHQDNVWLNNDSVDMIWSGHDTQSGLSHFFVEGSTYAANIAGTTITLADGSHNLTIEAIDLVGHISAVANFQANVDMTDPEITSFTSATHPESTWTSNAVATFNWTGADAHSGISTYMLNGQDVGFVTTANIELADGMHDITLYAIDVAGNTSVIANYSVWVDTTAPSADSFTSSSHAEMTWSNISDVDLAWLGSEAVSEIDHYMLNGIDVGLSTSALHAASEGETVLELYAVDAAGNASNTLTYTVWVDTLNPTLDSFTSGSHTDSVWASNGTLDLAWTSSDATSGLAEYFLDGASVGLDVAAAIALSDGESTHTIYGVDAAGNTSNSLSFTAWVDVTSPSLDSFTSDSHTDSEWASNDTLNLAWAGSDATSGVAEYILNGTSVGMDLAKALTLSDGQHLNEIYAIDEAGNVSATLSFTAWVDVTSPAMSSLTSSSHTDRAWANNGTLDLAWLASDATSGVAEYFLNGASVGLDLSAALPLADGQFLNEIYSVDNAGNASNTLGFTAWIDTTAPALDSLTSSSHTDSVWSADGTLNLAWAGSDDTSGVVEYFLNGVSVGMDLAAALTPGDGETTHTVYAVDAAGISSDTLSFTAWIDTTEPTVDSFTSATHPDGVWVSNDSVELSWAASDEGSAVASYELNGIDVGLDTSATLTPGEGTHSMTLVAYDSVGLVSATSTYEVRIDTILPNLDSLTSSSHIDSVWSTDNALNLAWVGSDDTSGVVEYFLNGASVGMDLAAALTAGEGKNDHTVYSVDAAGNVSATLSFTAWVDTIAPSADSFTSSSHSDGVWSGIADVSLAWTGSDDTSGVVSYFLNGVDMGLSLDMILAQADGENANTLYAVDAAGNQSSTLNFASWIDTDAPSMLSFTSSSHTDSVWGNAAELSLAWAASDNHSGIAEYFLNGVSVGLSLADAFEPGDGVHLNEIYAVDTVGNVSDTLTFTAWIDATIPTVSELASTSHTSHTWSTDGTVDFIWSGSDETSGIDYFDLNGVTYPAGSTGATLILADGVHSVMLVGYDHAGNSDYATFEVWVDTTGPSLGALSSSTHADATWTQSTGLTLEWASAPDDGIGFSHFLLNGSDVGSSLSYSETLASGQHNYELVAVDDLGNESASSFFAAWVDTDTPTIGSFTSSSHTAGVWNASSSVDLTYAASDLHSGLSHLLVNGTLWDGISAVTVADGASTLTLVAVDLVGLESAPVSLDVWVDTTGPTGTLSIDNGGSYTVSSLVDLTLSASDIDSGMSEMRLSNDGATWSTWQVYGASITDWDLTLYGGNGNANEFHTVYVNYRDAVGNTAETSDQIYFLEEIVADSASLSASAAATQTVNFDLAAGPEFAHRAYALYGSALAGSYLLPGGLVSLPFAEDSAMTTIAGAGFPGFEGVLDADGLGAATMNVPVGSIHPLFVGRDLMFALALHDGTGTVYDHVSSTIETIYLDN